jgi:predicted alpha/beta hydrolase
MTSGEVRGSAPAADGYELAITRFSARETPWATMLFAGAMGVRQDFYAPLARYFAERGIHVLTFDYRGQGWSRPKSLAALDASVSDWAEKDMNAMLGEARNAAPHLPLTLMGHSLGGQILGLLPDNAGVRAAINVTAASGWYRYNDRIPIRVRIVWFLAMPLLTPLFGYFPGKRLRIVGDLPKGVANQWRRWCLHPEYVLSEGPRARAAFDRVTAPILAFSFEDDDIVTRPAVESLNGFYRNARVEHRHVAPAGIGAKRIGHFGFFAERSRPNLWAQSVEWLQAYARA